MGASVFSAKPMSALASQLHMVLQLVGRWHMHRLERQRLLRLDDSALKDLGLSRADAYREGLKPFWRR